VSAGKNFNGDQLPYDRDLVDPDTAIGGPVRHFPSTRQTLLDAAAGSLDGEALDRVVALYWKPVYHFLRMKFRRNNEDAKDLTQSFFATALQRQLFARFDPAKASFRTYLRMAVERFAANEYSAAQRQKRGGGVIFETAGEHSAMVESPEALFEREWQRQLFVLAIEDLKSLSEANGKTTQFRIFASYDLAEQDRPSYGELATMFSIPETDVTNYLAWARRTLRALVTERLRRVTAGERELRGEMRRIWT
jgi:RNA polymerase sigma-70 factor (ECF subfamily)